jgi:sorting nexin-29
MRPIFEKCHEYNTELYILYIDFKQAFDTVNRQIMLQRLQETGIPNKLIRLIKMTIQYTRASVVVENLKTDPFDILTGVRQGDPLSATLFNPVLESVIRKLKLRSDISSQLIQINAYADDIALIVRTKKALIEIFNKISEEATLVGLHINEDKTKYMYIKKQGQEIKDPYKLIIIPLKM